LIYVAQISMKKTLHLAWFYAKINSLKTELIGERL